MAKIFLSYLVLYGLNFNIVAASGAGVLQFEREKMYPAFRYLSALFLMIGVAICGTINYLLERYVYSVYDIAYINISVIVLIAGIYNLIVATIWRKSTSFNQYLYSSSYGFPFDFVFTIFCVISLNNELAAGNFFLSLLAMLVVIFVMNVIIGFFVKSMNRGYMNTNFRNIPARLFFFAIVLVLLYYASGLVIL